MSKSFIDPMIDPAPGPFVRQWRSVRAALAPHAPKLVLLVRLGDFYEAFDDDAKALSEVCKLTLTSRVGVPMSGMPYFSVQRYTKILTDAGYAVALIEYFQVKPL